MAFVIHNPPEFTLDVEQWTRQTKANGEQMAKNVIEPMLNNDIYLKEHLEELDGNAVKDGDKGTPGGVATLGENGKLVQHVEYNNVDNIPDTAWDDVTNKPRTYPPSFHTHNKSEVGLGNVDNTADADKRVAYAASAGDADTLDGKHASAFATASHSHSAATTSAAGLMSATDKTKLNGIADKANNYSHPSSAGNKHIPAGGSSGQILRWSADGTAAWGADNNTTYSVATQSANGLMSAADKKKLDEVATKANVTPSGLMSGYVQTGQSAGTTIGMRATIEGYANTASGSDSHAEGSANIASENNSHAEGNGTVASGGNSHTEGVFTTASGRNSHAEGGSTVASGEYSHAEGSSTVASGSDSHAEGSNTTASGNHSHAGGNNTIASTYAQTAIGYYNVQYGTNANSINSYFIVGNGSSSARSNAFRVHYDGAAYGKKAYNTSGADYAEYFEWLDGNPETEDRRGYFVTLDGDKIRIATSKDNYILGVISGRPSVIGNSDPDDWHGHFLVDDFGEFIMEKAIDKRPILREEIYTDEETGEEKTRIVEDYEEVEVNSYALNPDYDPDRPYVPRSERPEWAAVGMLGVLLVRDDGTCQVNSYCKVADGGIATAAETGWRVIARVNEWLVKIVFR